MKIIKLKGGLGNQMFQYSFAKALAKELQEEFCLDNNIYENFKERNFGLNEFKIKVPFFTGKKKSSKFKFGTYAYKISVFLENFFDKNYFFENKISFFSFEKLKKYNYYDGYWQDEKYFINIREELLKEFDLKKTLNFSSYIGLEENSVAIGFRRGDYFSVPKNKKMFDNCSEEYYKSAITYIEHKMSNLVFYVFSDDIAWVKKNINFLKKYKVVFVNEDKKKSPSEELILMSKCKHAIIPNSTFSWWGAWLIENKQKIVIAPEGWFAKEIKNNIIPKEWIQINKEGVVNEKYKYNRMGNI